MVNHGRFAKFAKLSRYMVYLFRVQKYFLKQLVAETHKLVVETHSIFTPIVLLAQVSLMTIVNWSMG